ncbi:MAG: S8 family peptidase [Lachnospiraceae bacterium]|nr:S8 family peptidase [Lachnospiraceae bacterium]
MTCKEMILSNEYADIINFDAAITTENSVSEAYCVQELYEDKSIIYVRRDLIPSVGEETYWYNYVPKLYGLMQDIEYNPLSLIASGILQLQRPPLELTGRNVIIGVIDTGIRYEEDVFRRSDGSSRILSIWDQTNQDGIPPEGFYYGSEYDNEMINIALRSENPRDIVPSYDENGHGTAMASVAAGSIVNKGLYYNGAAPDADIVVVKLKEAKQYLRDYYYIPEGVACYEDADILQAVQYVEQMAVPLQRPVVIVLGIGTNMGDHTGNDALSLFLNDVAGRSNRVVVVCGGNEGNAAHHYEGMVNNNTINNWDDVEIRVGPGEQGFVMELWGTLPYLFNVSVRSPRGETTPEVVSQIGNSIRYEFIFEGTIVEIGYWLVEQRSGEELITLRFTNPTEGIWTIRVTGIREPGIGTYHMWLPITAFLRSETYFLRPNPYITLTAPGLAENVITMSTYDDRNDSFYQNSGRGFSRLGVVKPELAAPGVDIPTALGVRTGSSLAAAMTAGGVAQFLQWAVVEGNNPYVDTEDVKNYLIRGGTREERISYPSREWGYGRLNVMGVFDLFADV